MQEKNKIKTLALLAMALAILEFFLLYKYFFKKNIKLEENQKSCEVISETKYIRGISMEPILKPEQEITALMGYYDCHPIERNDVVLVNYAGDDNPLIKFVRAVPGDKFHVQKNGETWQIVVNGEILKNSEGIEYNLDEKKAQMIAMYEKDKSGMIPEDTYLILGNMPAGSMDSTQFGLVGNVGIVAKVGFKQ
jgi:signal peptidase I